MNAVLDLTDGGAWLAAIQRLCMKMQTCGLYADSDKPGIENLDYPGFKEKWKAAAGRNGFVEKTKIKKFVIDLLHDKHGEPNGMWYEAFIVSLERLRMDVKSSTALELFKTVDKGMDGFLSLDDFSELIKTICDCGIWETAYLQFLEVNKIELPQQVKTKFWNYLNEEIDNPGLVPIDKVCDRLDRLIMNTGLLIATLKTVMELLDVAVNEVELSFIHKMLDTREIGFIADRDIFKVLDKINRRGLPFSHFKMCVKKMEMRFDDEELYDVFSTLDINQDGLLDVSEFKGGMAILCKARLPTVIMVKLGMSPVQMMQAVAIALGCMCLLFAFLLLGLNSFGGGRSTTAKIQSTFSAAISYGGSSGGDSDPDAMTRSVKTMIAMAMGVAMKD
jgi:Ca2+-binding EF-hand superfamily protein